MKILWVSCRKLLPADTGGKIRTYNILRHLFTRQEVTLLSYYVGRRDRSYECELIRRFPGSVVLCTGGPDAGLFELFLDYIRKLAWVAPYTVAKFAAPQVRSLLEAWIRERRFDVVVCDFLCVSINFPEALTTPTVLFQHNVETMLWRRQAHWESNPAKKLVLRLEAAKLARYEASALKRFHRIVAVSQRDREEMGMMVDPSRISVVPTGVDLEQCQPSSPPVTQNPLVMFVGSMDWDANIDGAEFFCNQVWPRVRAAVPAARFRIVGRSPHPRVQKLVSESVEVTGTVPSVIEHLKEATVVVVPLRIGGGTRLKILEAMAMGKAVVSTSVGAEGLDVYHGLNILLVDDAAKFADAIITLIRSQEFREQVETAAARLAAHYDWSVVAERFAEALELAAGWSAESERVNGGESSPADA